ncbi:MAG TPA: orotidine-5'-phosphate decarboxylase [Planctomycetaceae bacterium]|nr:orotidine-5'-phosphate decarboxylase [Planctomycetaceae bacterium]
MSEYAERLNEAVRMKGTPVLVGIDPRLDQLPQPIVEAARRRTADACEAAAAAFEEFACRLIDVVAPQVPAVKPQAAFFERYGPPGCRALRNVIRYARRRGLIVICDAKRGDIGSTAEAYADAYLAGRDPEAAPWGADALTVNPYLGRDTLEPFVRVAQQRGAGLYVLVRTSNPGAGTFQDWERPGRPLYAQVAAVVEQLAAETAGSSDFGVVGAVVGATYPRELAELRETMPHALLLVPGYGSQGAGAADVAPAFHANGLGALINSSRAINFAYRREPYASQFGPTRWEEATEVATRRMIADLAAKTPAGVLRGNHHP